MFPGAVEVGWNQEDGQSEKECPLGLEKRHGQTAGSIHYFGAFGGWFS